MRTISFYRGRKAALTADTGSAGTIGTPLYLRVAGLAYLASTPLETLPLGSIGSPARILGPVFIVLWLFHAMTSRESLGPRGPMLALLGLVTWSALTVQWSVDPTTTISTTLSLAGLSLTALALARVFRSERLAPAWAMALGATMAALPILNGSPSAQRAGRISYLDIDENIMAFHLVLGAAAWLYIVISDKRVLARLIAGGGILTTSVAVALTGSRTGFGACVIVIVVAVLVSLRSILAAVLSLCVAVGAVATYSLLSNAGMLSQRIVDFVEAPRLSDGRDAIIGAYLHTVDVWIWRGVGAGADSDYLLSTGWGANNAHSAFWKILIETGIVGGVLWLLVLALVVKGAWRAPTRDLLMISAPAVVAFFYTLGPILSNQLWALFGLALAGYAARRPPTPKQVDAHWPSGVIGVGAKSKEKVRVPETLGTVATTGCRRAFMYSEPPVPSIGQPYLTHPQRPDSP